MTSIDGTHVSETDLQGLTPLSEREHAILTGPDGYPGWRPTRKWVAGLAGSVASVIASWVLTGAFDDVERGMVATALVALTSAYFQTNEPTPGGVPESKD